MDGYIPTLDEVLGPQWQQFSPEEWESGLETLYGMMENDVPDGRGVPLGPDLAYARFVADLGRVGASIPCYSLDAERRGFVWYYPKLRHKVGDDAWMFEMDCREWAEYESREEEIKEYIGPHPPSGQLNSMAPAAAQNEAARLRKEEEDKKKFIAAEFTSYLEGFIEELANKPAPAPENIEEARRARLSVIIDRMDDLYKLSVQLHDGTVAKADGEASTIGNTSTTATGRPALFRTDNYREIEDEAVRGVVIKMAELAPFLVEEDVVHLQMLQIISSLCQGVYHIVRETIQLSVDVGVEKPAAGGGNAEAGPSRANDNDNGGDGSGKKGKAQEKKKGGKGKAKVKDKGKGKAKEDDKDGDDSPFDHRTALWKLLQIIDAALSPVSQCLKDQTAAVQRMASGPRAAITPDVMKSVEALLQASKTAVDLLTATVWRARVMVLRVWSLAGEKDLLDKYGKFVVAEKRKLEGRK